MQCFYRMVLKLDMFYVEIWPFLFEQVQVFLMKTSHQLCFW